MGDRVLVTGGAGFIGSTLVRALRARGDAVVVLDDLTTGRAENLAGIDGDVTFIEASILDAEALTRAIASCRFVFHLAAQISVPKSIEDPVETHEVNGTGTLRVLEAARAAGVERVVFAASCAIYGNDPTLPKRETMPIDPLSPYSVTKHLGETYAACYTATMGLDVVALRFFNVFGPRQDPAGGYAAVIPIFVTRLLAGKPLTVHGDGEQTRDFVFVANIVEALLAAAVAPDAPGRVFNVGTGQQTSLNQLIATLEEILGRRADVTRAPGREGDVRHSVADVSLAREVLGYRGDVDLAAGLAQTVAWYQQGAGEEGSA